MEYNQIENLISFVFLFHPASNRGHELSLQSPDYVYDKYCTFINIPINKKFKKSKRFNNFLNDYYKLWFKHKENYPQYLIQYKYENEIEEILQFLYETVYNRPKKYKYLSPYLMIDNFNKYIGDSNKINKNKDGYYTLHQIFRSDLLLQYVKKYERDIKLLTLID